MQPRLLKHPARLAGASLLRLQDDARLVALAREGHDPAFAAIVDRYGGQLERYCARLLGPGRAEDAVQQAFVNAHAAMRASEQELALKPWLYRIAHNAAMNILRASRDDDALELERPGAVLTADVVELRERLRETLAAVQALPAAQRDAILLRELEGRSHEEIAAALGVTAGGARQHLHRARLSLRAAASAITPYPILARMLDAAAETGRVDIVSGAGLGAGASAMKVAAGVLAAGAIAGGAVGVQGHHVAPKGPDAAQAATDRSTTAPSEANGPSATPLQVADHQSAGAPSRRGRDGGGARGREGTRGRDGSGNGRLLGDRRSGAHDGPSRLGAEDHHGSSPSGTTGEDRPSSSSGTSGPDNTTTEASHESTTTSTTTTDGGSSGSSGSDSGPTLTTPTTTTDSSGTGSLSGGSLVTTTDH